MDDEERRRFAHVMCKTPQIMAIDEAFLEEAQEAFKDAGTTALEFLRTHPGLSRSELAQELANHSKRRTRPIGIVMAVYQEAQKAGALRETAKDMLAREILAEFPQGWSSSASENVSPIVRLSIWSHFEDYLPDPRLPEYTLRILQYLAGDHGPPKGWKPRAQNDPLLNGVFDRFWPAEPPS